MIVKINKEKLNDSLKMAVDNIEYIKKCLKTVPVETVENYLETVKAQVEEALKIVYKNSHVKGNQNEH